MKINFTGNPFVDSGLSAMCVAAGVENISALDVAAINRAVDELLRLMTSESAFKQREFLVGKQVKKTAFITSEMSVIFTNNNALSNPSNKGAAKRDKYVSRVRGKLEALVAMLENPDQPSAQRCFVDGNPACISIGNDEFPLVDSRSKRNFHPGLGEGHPVGALTALAVEFFPLSVLRTGPNSGFFWFVHTAQEPIAMACAHLTRNTMNDAISKGRDFGFFGDWDVIKTRSKEAALVALVRQLTCGGKAGNPLRKGTISKIDYPVTAYIFSNDSRSPSIEMHDLPHPLFHFFIQLQGSEALRRWDNEVLGSEKKGWLLARAMLQQQPLIGLSIIRPNGEKPGLLRGGWLAHAHYAKEVLHMSAISIRDIEALATQITEHEDAKKLIFALQSPQGPGEVRRAFLRLCQKGLLSHETYARLLPPDEPFSATNSRDYLLAAIYEIQHAKAKGQPFMPWDSEATLDELKKQTAIVPLAAAIGKQIAIDERSTRFTNDLAHATKTHELRQVMLRAAQRGLVSWYQWVEFFPPDKPYFALLARDYVLAYLYSHLRDTVEPLPEPQPADSKELKEVSAVA